MWTSLFFLGACHVADADKEKAISQQSIPRDGAQSAACHPVRADGLDEPTVNLTGRERQVLKQAVKLEILAYLDGQQSSYTDDSDIADRPTAITSGMLQLKYERDKHRADNEFLGRHLIVTGRVASFKRMHGMLVSVRLDGGSTIFQRPIVSMVLGYPDHLMTLTKFEHASFSCRGAGTRWGSALLVDCVPADSWVAAETERYEASFLKLPIAAFTKKASVVLSVARIAQLLSVNSACFSETETKKCEIELNDYTEEVIMAHTTPAQWAALSQRVFGSAYPE
ncbi:hypothetical protein [Caballeronia sp. HLA56]